MTTLQMRDDCHTNDLNNLFPIAFDSSRFPLDRSMRVVFTGYYNGFSVEVRSTDEITLLYHMGYFGKGSASRSKPKLIQNDGGPCIMRKRQYLMRNSWYKKFKSLENSETDSLLKEMDDLVSNINEDSKRHASKNVIDLVSSEDESSQTEEYRCDDQTESFSNHDKQNIVVIVPNSDSEGDDYFANLKPKSCINKIKLEEKLILTLQESFFLSYALGCLQIVNIDNKLLDIQQCWQLFTEADSNFVPKYVVYHYFKSKGYIVKPGIKFGGDYLLYKEGPGHGHADYIVVINSNEKTSYSCKWTSVLGHIRMANTTVKEILIAEVVYPQGNVSLPDDLRAYTVREILLNRNIPIVINEDIN